jgi:two-component system chemotaxis response regulator CheB
MPRAALAAVRRARSLPAGELGPAIAVVVAGTPGEPPAQPNRREDAVAGAPTTSSDLGVPAALGCPECQGGMFESTPGGTVTYTCHVGHAWSAQTLLDAQRETVEAAVYNAASKLLEMAAVHRRLAEVDGSGVGGTREEHLAAARAFEARAEQIGRLATEQPPLTDPSAEDRDTS